MEVVTAAGRGATAAAPLAAALGAPEIRAAGRARSVAPVALNGRDCHSVVGRGHK